MKSIATKESSPENSNLRSHLQAQNILMLLPYAVASYVASRQSFQFSFVQATGATVSTG